MARNIRFSVRGSRRFRRTRSDRTKILCMIVAAVLFLAGARYFVSQKTPVAAVAEDARSKKTPFILESMYLNIVSFVIPGLFGMSELPVIANTASSQEGRKLALPDFRNPKLLVYSQLPYLLDPAIIPQPLMNEEPESSYALPKITIPIRHELTGEGKILIYHTHATETFEPTAQKWFSTDLSMTVVQLGVELTDLLQKKFDIPVIHNSTIHDHDRNKAYEMARPTLEAILMENPDTELVIDLHRDGVDRDITTAILDGKPAGRILFVVGTRHDAYEANLFKALFLHEVLEELAPGISRGVRQRPLVYNQNYHPGSLLIELGGYQNSIEEVRLILPVLAEAINRLYHSQEQP